MIAGNKDIAKWATDLDVLLNFEKGSRVFWTAPKWLTEGDVIFFYQTKQANSRSSRLLAEAREKFPRKRSLITPLTRARDNARLYAGSIFACASVAGATELFEKQEKHFISRLFAPLGEVHVFENPLPQEKFAEYVKIGRSTITPLFKKEFDGIKKLLSKENESPDFLRRASFGDKAFKNVDVSNWRSISCSPGAKFIHESQLRAYLVDFLLNEIKDKDTPLLEECECFRGQRKTGRADYFIKVFGQWIPVEAKLDISREKNLLVQTAKYINISSFVPQKGSHRNETFNIAAVPICLVVDRMGLYFISGDNEFIESGFENPSWRRENLTKNAALKIREYIKRIQNKSKQKSKA